jgi:hypothetical protein
MLLDHLEGILNYCRTKVPMGVIEAVNGNIKALLRRGRGYRDMNYLLLKGAALGSYQDPIPCSSESRVACAFIQILVQSLICAARTASIRHILSVSSAHRKLSEPATHLGNLLK